MLEADSYAGPSLLIAYCHCIAHGFDLRQGLEQQKRAVQSGHWPLYRFDPRKKEDNNPGLLLDSKRPTLGLGEYMSQETRFSSLHRSHPERAQELLLAAERSVQEKYDLLERLAQKSR
jgi:pyruvate-ferredoxin/flavodoxin oxidoreductase